MQKSAHEGAGGDHHGLPVDAHAEIGFDSADALFAPDQCGGVPLPQGDAWGLFKHRLGAELVRLLIALRPRRADAGALFGIQHPELDPGGVGIQSHKPAEGVDLADDLSLGLSADGGVAGHLPDGVEVLSEHQSGRSKPRGG